MFWAISGSQQVERSSEWKLLWSGFTADVAPLIGVHLHRGVGLCGAAGIRLQTGFNPKDMSLETSLTLWSRLKYLNMTAVYEEHEYD